MPLYLTPTNNLGQLIVQAQASYSRITALLPVERWSDVDSLSEPIRQEIFSKCFDLSKYFDAIDEITDQFALSLDAPVMRLSEGHVEFYRNVLSPQREKISDLMWKALGLGSIDFGPALADSEHTKSTGKEVWRFIAFAIDRCDIDVEEGELEVCSEEAFKGAQKLLHSRVFSPDEWLARLRHVEPLLTEKSGDDLPTFVRHRFREVFDSFLIGHFAATIALSRALLEFALLQNANRLGYEAYRRTRTAAGKATKAEAKRLGELINLASEHQPELEIEMRALKRMADRVLHPREHVNVSEFPRTSGKDALKAVTSIQSIIHRLYLA